MSKGIPFRKLIITKYVNNATKWLNNATKSTKFHEKCINRIFTILSEVLKINSIKVQASTRLIVFQTSSG